MARQPAKPALLNRIQLKCGVPKAVDGNVKPTFRRDTDVQPAQIGLQGIKIVPRVGFRCAGRVGTISPSYGVLPNHVELLFNSSREWDVCFLIGGVPPISRFVMHDLTLDVTTSSFQF